MPVCTKCKKRFPKSYFQKGKIMCKRCKNCRGKEKRKCKCGITAWYGYSKDRKAIYCAKCKLPGMIPLHRRCFCGLVSPAFGYEGGNPTHCVKCKEEGMISLKRRLCVVCNIGTKRYGLENTSATHCYKCKTDEMVNMVDDLCSCGKKPHYGLAGQNPVCCGQCKTKGMINLFHPLCSCGEYAYYGEGSIKTHCRKCKTESMKIIQKDSRVCPCGTRVSFGIKGEKPTCCKNCKTEDMIRSYNNICECGTRVSYGYENPTHCSKCRLPDMTNLTERFCDECKSRVRYGFPLNYPTKCAQHKQDGMILNPTKKCSMCTEKAKYGVKQAIHCEKHKKPNEIDLVERKCKKCGRIDVVNSDRLCINFCLLNTEGYEIYKKYRKEKQERVVKLLKEKVGNPSSIDRIIDTECGKERPDIVYDCKTHGIIVEVDEHKHRGYKCKDGVDGEKMRMINLYMALGFEKLLFIRYNPDSYKGEDGKILRTQSYIRERVLVKCVKHYMKNIDSVKNLGVLYLYYDGFNEQRSKILNIDPYMEYNV